MGRKFNYKDCIFYKCDDDEIGYCKISENIVDGAEEPCNDFKNNTGNFKYFDYV